MVTNFVPLWMLDSREVQKIIIASVVFVIARFVLVFLFGDMLWVYGVSLIIGLLIYFKAGGMIDWYERRRVERQAKAEQEKQREDRSKRKISKCLSCLEPVNPDDNHCKNCGFDLQKYKT